MKDTPIEYAFDMNELRKLMDEYGDNISSLALYIGTTRQNISQVFNGEHGFTYQQTIKIAKKYDLDADTFFKVFVKPGLDKLS